MSARELLGIATAGLLAGIGFATLFIHFMTGGCIP